MITDWVANHSAPDNPWIKSHPEFYAKDSTGKMYGPFDWTDVRKLDYNNRGLRDSMIAAMKFWLNETGIDGFRCDVAAEVPNDFWKECITALRAIRPNIFMLAEPDKPELHAPGFDVTYGWQAMHAMKDLYTGKYTLAQFDSVQTQGLKDFPKDAARLFFTTNHDENIWNGTEYEKFGNAAKAFAVFTQTYAQSIPLIYSGQELTNKKRLKFFVKDTIGWTGKCEMAPFYQTLLTLRKTNPALEYDASYRKLSSTNEKAVYAYVREKEGRKVVVVMNLSKQGQKFKMHWTPKRPHKLAGVVETAIEVDFYWEGARPLALQPVGRAKHLRSYMEQWGWRWTDLKRAHPDLVKAMVFDPDSQQWDSASMRIGEEVYDIFVPIFDAEQALDAVLAA